MKIYQEDIKRVFKKKELYQVIENISSIAQRHNVRCALVGGIVRDIIILKSRENISIKSKDNDIDFVVEGDAKGFVEVLITQGLAESARYYKRFNTTKVKIKNNYYIDIATARTEKYKRAGAQPDVEFSTLNKDLFRRDFTINSIALELGESEAYRAIDLYNGVDDIKNGIIQPIHSKSFIDDPSRILRAIRFSVRFNFSINDSTLKLIEDVLQNDIFKKITLSRLYRELFNILEEESWIECLLYMKDLNIIEHFPQPLGSSINDFLNNITKEKIKKINSSINSLEYDIIPVVRYSTLFGALDKETFLVIGKNLFTTKRYIEALKQCSRESVN